MCLFFGQLIDPDTHRKKFDPSNFLINLKRNGIDSFPQGSMVLHQIFRGKGLVRKTHIHDTGGMALRRSEIDQSPLSQQIDTSPLFQLKLLHEITNFSAGLAVNRAACCRLPSPSMMDHG